MVSQCANPECGAEFLYFGDGQLVAVEPRVNSSNSTPELFWLCGNCIQHMKMKVGTNGSMDLIPCHNFSDASQQLKA